MILLQRMKVPKLWANGDYWGRYKFSNKSHQLYCSKWTEALKLIQEDESGSLTNSIKSLRGWEVLGVIQEERNNQLEWANKILHRQKYFDLIGPTGVLPGWGDSWPDLDNQDACLHRGIGLMVPTRRLVVFKCMERLQGVVCYDFFELSWLSQEVDQNQLLCLVWCVLRVLRSFVT